jgi:Acyl-CoA carboxylase epsilon subunit
VSADRPVLRAISPDATPEEVAAIVAAIAECSRTTAAPEDAASSASHDWASASKLTARRVALTRGSWRLSGRIPRRTRP